jgi:hypothetical protein
MAVVTKAALAEVAAAPPTIIQELHYQELADLAVDKH